MTDLNLFDGEELLALARIDIEANRLDAALAKAKHALQLKDFPIQIKALSARLYAQLGLFEKAKTLYTEYLAVVPNSTLEFFQLGMVSFDERNFDAALSIWSELLNTTPTHPPALYYSAIAKNELGNPEDAKRDIDILLKSAPVDNLYVGKGKEFLAMLDGVPPATARKRDMSDVYN